MGRRSRKRGEALAAREPAPAGPPARRAAAAGARPRAPWHPFPLVESRVLIGLDTALREHFGGHRSHALLLAALPAVLAAVVLFFIRAPWVAVTGCALAVLAAAFTALRRAFRGTI